MLVCFASPPPHRSPQCTLKHFVQAIFKCLTSLLPLTSIKQKFFFTLLNPIMKQMLNYKAGQGISMAEKKDCSAFYISCLHFHWYHISIYKHQ